MTDKSREDIERGAHAERLLNDEMLKNAFAKMEGDYIAAWMNTKIAETEGREKLWQAVQIVGLVQSHLKKLLIDGQLAKKDIEEIPGLGKKKFLNII